MNNNDIHPIYIYTAYTLLLELIGSLTGTVYVSSIWNSAGASLFRGVWGFSRFRNMRSKSSPAPVTFDTWKIGHMLQRGLGECELVSVLSTA